MIWSVLTKYLLRCVQQKGTAIEIPSFAIFGPIIDKFASLKDPLEKGPARGGLTPKSVLNPVIAVINEDFVESAAAQIDFKSERAVGLYN